MIVSRLPAAAALAVLLAAPLPAPAAGPPDPAQAASAVVAGSNAFRAEEGVPALAVEPKLTAAARGFAEFMANTDRYGHEADGREPVERAQAQGYEWCLVAENIAMQYSSAGFGTQELAENLVRGWIESPGHRRNLLNRASTQTGVAIAQSTRSGRYYAVQVFGRPAALKLRFEVSNRSGRDLQYRLGDTPYPLPNGMTRRHEQCEAAALELRLPGQARPARVQPVDGGRYRVETSGGRLRLVGG